MTQPDPVKPNVIPRWDDGLTLLYLNGTFYVHSIKTETVKRGKTGQSWVNELHEWVTVDHSAYGEFINDFAKEVAAADIELDEGYYVLQDVDNGDSLNFRWEPNWTDTSTEPWTTEAILP